MIQDSCHMGMEYINLLMQNHQQALDAALMRSVQLANGAGMQGEPLPYMLRSDAKLPNELLGICAAALFPLATWIFGICCLRFLFNSVGYPD